jgi:hypothetical protein
MDSKRTAPKSETDCREPTEFAFQHLRLQLKAQYALGREAVALEEALSMCGEVLDAFTVMESMFARQKLHSAELVVEYARNLRVNISLLISRGSVDDS